MWRILVALGVFLVVAGLVVLALGAAIFVSYFGNALIATGAVSVSSGIIVVCLALVLKEVARINARFDALEGQGGSAGAAPLALADDHAEREAQEEDYAPLDEYEPPAAPREPPARARLPFGDAEPAPDLRRGRVLDRPQEHDAPVPERVVAERAGLERALDRSLERAAEQMPERGAFERAPAARNPLDRASLDRPPQPRAPQERAPQERPPQDRPVERNPLDRNPLDRNPFDRIPADRMPLGSPAERSPEFPLPERAQERAPQERPPQPRMPQDRAPQQDRAERAPPPRPPQDRPPQDRPVRPRIGSDLLPERQADIAPQEPSAPQLPATTRPPARRTEIPEPTVLKSGIVGGMAYTLYSDGSIQAELPDGVLRFSSLQELRDHVSKSSPPR